MADADVALVLMNSAAETAKEVADQLRDKGYRTFGISANGLLSREAGFAQGFEVFEQLAVDVLFAEQQVAEAIGKMRA